MARVRKPGPGKVITPQDDARRVADPDEWFAAMDRLGDAPFMPEGREQPPLPAGD